MAIKPLRSAGNGFAESEALSQAFSYLVNSIDAAALLPAAMGKKLITECQRSECAREPDPYKKAEMFLGHLQRAVNGDCGKFHTFVKILRETRQDKIARKLDDILTTRSVQLTTTAEGDVKRKTFADGTDELPKHAKNEGFGERFPEMAAQFDKVIIQTKSTRAEVQSLTKTHDEESNDSAATTATSEEAAAGWHAKFYSFKQQTQEKFEEKAEEIRGLEQLIRNSDKNQQYQTNELTSNTLKALMELSETQAEMSRLIHENSNGIKEEIKQLRTEQERHGQILEDLKRVSDEIPAIKSLLEKIQGAPPVSHETHPIRMEPIQLEMITTQLKEELRIMTTQLKEELRKIQEGSPQVSHETHP